jgi:hypothetical protein
VSTLIPGTTPRCCRMLTNGVPLLAFWYRVSSNRIWWWWCVRVTGERGGGGREQSAGASGGKCATQGFCVPNKMHGMHQYWCSCCRGALPWMGVQGAVRGAHHSGDVAADILSSEQELPQRAAVVLRVLQPHRRQLHQGPEGCDTANGRNP